ncbi:hypothetical protein MBRA1_003422 [Malassezia brasiliensis]|uniref:Protein kinase domain-containing protein n=1 Tax=Malassezia brasiliensis TaxID=1821822 RepID=A0AAF0E087_9BASI|nr:hypothetical protein MBRA1_003422 [Malassezia brasiliensis]
MPPFEKWRLDFNEKLDRLGEEHLNKLRGNRSMNSSYEERLASMRGAGSAAETMAGAPQQRHMPPLPPDMAPMPQTHPVPASTAAAPAAAPAYSPPSTTHIAYSQFTEADKQAFFALLDEAHLLLPVGRGLCSVVSKAPMHTATPVLETHGGVRGWLCLKHVDIDEQNAPHDVEREVALLRATRHDHVATLLAAFTETPDAFTTVHHLAMPLYPVGLLAILDAPHFAPHAPPFAAEAPAAWGALLAGETYVTFVGAAMRQLLDAVAYLHAEGIAHRDIKPANVMLGTDGRVRLIDLGVAWSPAFPETTAYARAEEGVPRAMISEVGTGAFRAPELLFAPTRGYDAYQADMWSLGVLFASFFTALQETAAPDGDDEDWDEAPALASWERALWPAPGRPRARRAARVETHRATLFDASRGDIGLAGDLFDVLGLPSSVDAWPEAAHFQPPLAQFPFVPRAAQGSVLDRLPQLAALSDVPGGAPLAAWVRAQLPRLVRLSASARPTAREVLASLDV